MNKDNKELLESIIAKKLAAALYDDDKDDEKFKEAMKAIDRQIEINKLENSSIEQDQAKKDSKWGMIIKAAEIGATILIVPTIDYLCKRAFAERICTFEREDTFRTQAGKSLSGLFRFKK
ncbi:MAG: hypothetical protein LBT06_10880 [Hungatella sp.]|jgi:hypothetical protein|nr:hypothetical protein [Hungatella sp.]